MFVHGFLQPSRSIITVSVNLFLVPSVRNSCYPSGFVITVFLELTARKGFLDDTSGTVEHIGAHRLVKTDFFDDTTCGVEGETVAFSALIEHRTQLFLVVILEEEHTSFILAAHQLPHPLISIFHPLVVVLIAEKVVDAVIGQLDMIAVKVRHFHYTPQKVILPFLYGAFGIDDLGTASQTVILVACDVATRVACLSDVKPLIIADKGFHTELVNDFVQ